MSTFVAETPRLRLRWLDDGDAGFIVDLLNDADFIRYVGDRGVRTLTAAEHYLAEGPVAAYARDGFSLNAVELKATGELAGICGLLRRAGMDDVEIGFAFLPRFRGLGYALEAAEAALQVGFENLGLRRIVAITALDNEDSMRLLGRLGLRFERLLTLPGQSEPLRLFARERTS